MVRNSLVISMESLTNVLEVGSIETTEAESTQHLTFDADIFERADAEAEAENKSLNEWMNNAAHEKAERKSQQQQLQSQSQPQSEPLDTQHLTLDEAERIIRDQIVPSIENSPPSSMFQDKDSVPPLLRSARILLETIEIKQGSRKRAELKDVPYTNPFEQARQEGLKNARERREKNERMELMSALPQPIEVMKEIDVDADLATSATDALALTTSSTLHPHLTEAEFLVLKQQQEDRDKRIQAYAKEAVGKMRAQAKDSVNLVDESKEIPTDEDIPVSPADGDEGVLEDDSDKVPQDEF